MVMSNSVNKHFDAVGSYLRPAELKKARVKFANNEITADELRSVEDRLIEDVIKKQKAHMTVKELAARVHLSTSPTFERQKRLEREGYIKRYSAVVDHHKMGHSVIVLCNIRLKQHTHELIQQFMDTVQTIDQITECYNTTGDYDFLIKVYAHDMKDYQDFMLNTLGNIDCIGSLHSIIVIGEIKDSHYIPVSRCY
jgi:Lrp/AsnC family transcriptional regulator, leucine-responsive regulatory protein